jgi:hypothetical protein
MNRPDDIARLVALAGVSKTTAPYARETDCTFDLVSPAVRRALLIVDDCAGVTLSKTTWHDRSEAGLSGIR